MGTYRQTVVSAKTGTGAEAKMTRRHRGKLIVPIVIAGLS
jgi:hypothetical protein